MNISSQKAKMTTIDRVIASIRLIFGDFRRIRKRHSLDDKTGQATTVAKSTAM
jgi:hypothetical protein